MFDRSDDADGDSEPFSGYGDLSEEYQEPDPESDLDLGPDVPRAPKAPRAPEASGLPDNDVDPAVSTRFWALVAIFNVGLLVAALGVMYIVFLENFTVGGRLGAAGGIILAYGLYQYRKSKRIVEEKLDDSGADDETELSETADSSDTDQSTLPRGRMRTVEDADGTRYLLLKESGESSLVQDPDTGETTHLPNDEFDVIEGESPLETASSAVPDAVRTLVTAAHDEQALGLLLEIETRGPIDVRTLTAAYDLCESDLHGMLAEFRAAGLLEEADIGGERGYDTTDDADAALAALVDRQ